MNNRRWIPGIPVQITKGAEINSRCAFILSTSIVIVIAIAVAVMRG